MSEELTGMDGDALLRALPQDVREEWLDSLGMLSRSMLQHQQTQARLMARLALGAADPEADDREADYAEPSAPSPHKSRGAEDAEPRRSEASDGPPATHEDRVNACKNRYIFVARGRKNSELNAAPEEPEVRTPGHTPTLNQNDVARVRAALRLQAVEEEGQDEETQQAFRSSRSVSSKIVFPFLHFDVTERLEELQSMDSPMCGMTVSQRAEMHSLAFIVWLATLQEPLRRGRVATFARCSYWEGLVSLVICINSIFMVYTVDYNMSNPFENMRLPRWAQMVELAFTVFFCFELALKLWVHRLYFFINDNFVWNVFDLILVALALLDRLSSVEGNATFLRSLRILRLARALRILKFATQLRCMMQSLLGSVMSLFWSFMMIVFIFFMFAIATVQVLTITLTPENGHVLDDNTVELIHEYFGTVFRCMMTYHFATSGGNDWFAYFEVLQRAAPLPALMFVLAIGVTQIGLMNILTGIFVENAMKLATPDRDALALRQRRADATLAQDLRRFLEQLDEDGSGTITRKEFSKIASDSHVKALLEVMGLDIRDTHLFFDMVMDNASNPEVEIHLLVDALMRIKGDATSCDVQALSFRLHRLSERIEHLVGSLPRQRPPAAPRAVRRRPAPVHVVKL